ncbi:hypothetical protein [Nostoc sp.]|uniref:hypothetical protein n=1 Tax=Nostoc sp. TaxID=1180 RepID=UPI002FF713E6
MIYQLQSQSNIQIVEDIFNILPSKNFGITLWIVSSVLTLLYLIYMLSKEENKIGKLLSLLIPSLIYIGTFINTFGILDEVTVNLEHPYNLYHFGKFSMSPDMMIDGTVEVLYYLLHTPFAKSQSSLILGNFLISLIVGWLHIFVLWQLQLTKSFLNNLILLSCFSLSFPIISIFASGFGNSLLSLLFLISIYLCLKNKLTFSLLVSGLLPLIRPDGILWSFANIATITLRRKTKPGLYSKIYYILISLLPFISIFIYLLLFKKFYGHLIPTPILFKSFKLSMLPMFDPYLFLNNILYWLLEPVNSFAFVVLVLLIYLKIKKPSWLEQNEIIKILMTYTVFTSLIFVFYNFTKSTINDMTGDIYSRYWLSFEVTLVLLLLVTISRSKLLIYVEEHYLTSITNIHFLPISLMFFLFITSVQLGIQRINDHSTDFFNRTYNVFAGALTEKILPNNFSISTSEMNTFGLMIDRPVLDLWGYTNRDIAKSKVCNGGKIKNNEYLFLEKRPNIYWAYWFPSEEEARQEHSAKYGFDTLEENFATTDEPSKEWNQLGDMNEVIKNYDFFIIQTNGKKLSYLVRKDSSDLLINHLKNKFKFQLIKSREIDVKYFGSLYNSQKKIQYNCS